MTAPGIAYTEHYAEDAHKYAAQLRDDWGFTLTVPAVTAPGTAQVLAHQGSIRVLVTSAVEAEHQVAEWVRRHGEGVAVIVPPCRSTIFLQIARPTPVPSYSSRPWSRWNTWQMRAACRSSNPTPLSAPVTPHPSRVAASETAFFGSWWRSSSPMASPGATKPESLFWREMPRRALYWRHSYAMEWPATFRP